ncbi:MAG TPA: sigma-54 dependent transcriptional regulator [Balneolaceae bacterium]|nr:sigma-54 dependent transcriptional regulator [Balneolaceae bacterium]
MIGSILIADDEEEIRNSLSLVLRDEGYQCATAPNGTAAIEVLKDHDFDILITDLKMPGADGIEVMNQCLQYSPETLPIIITAHATVDTAIQALRKGAADYILKPLDFDEVIIRIKNLLEHKRLIQENRYLREQIDQEYNFNHIIGESAPMKEVFRMIERVSQATSNVLVTGASGTGKELVARAIHASSDRSEQPFIAINCGAIPKDLVESELFGHKKGAFTGATSEKDGVFVAANKGTVFLDEVGEIPLNLQVSLLRVLQEREVKPVGGNETINFDTRIIAATNKDLHKEVEEDRFREDLFYRLNVVEIPLPPLSERKEDVPLLAHHFVEKYSRELNRPVQGISSEAMSAFLSYDWEGNVRELENVIERAVLLGDGPFIKPGDLPESIRSSEEETLVDSDSLDNAVQAFEKHHILSILKRTDGNKSKAARLLGIDPSTLYRKMERMDISD